MPSDDPVRGTISTDRRSLLRAAGVAGVIGIGGVATVPTKIRSQPSKLTEVAAFDAFHITGVAVDGKNRLFVNQPRFPWAVSNQGNRPEDADDVDASVVEVKQNGELEPYPNEDWNLDGYDQVSHSWQSNSYDPATHFVNVQSVYVDPENPFTLWILDTGNPELSGGEGVIEGGPKLVKVDAKMDEVEKKIFFDGDDVDGRPLTPEREDETGDGNPVRQSYLNDVRVTADQRYAFLTDSELGALVVCDLEQSDASEAVARRLFDDGDDFPELHAQNPGPSLGPHEGQESAAGPINNVHSDGIAIGADDHWVYYHALSGEPIYRSRVSELTDFDADPMDDIEIHQLGDTDHTDGMIADSEGVYHTALGRDAITRWNYGAAGTQTIVQDSDLIKWPDSFAIGPGGELYFTTSKIHLESGGAREKPFKVFKIKRKDLR